MPDQVTVHGIVRATSREMHAPYIWFDQSIIGCSKENCNSCAARRRYVGSPAVAPYCTVGRLSEKYVPKAGG